MEEISDEPLTGSRWATHHVVVWLENDATFVSDAQFRAREDESGDALRDFVSEVLWPEGEPYKLTADDRRTLANVRESFTREDFDGIDWPAVRESLLTE